MTNNDTAYEAHMKKVDAILRRATGMGHEDGEDTATRARFDAGLTPEQHCEAILDDWGFDPADEADDYADYDDGFRDAYNRELQEEALGRPLFPNEY